MAVGRIRRKHCSIICKTAYVRNAKLNDLNVTSRNIGIVLQKFTTVILKIESVRICLQCLL